MAFRSLLVPGALPVTGALVRDVDAVVECFAGDVVPTKPKARSGQGLPDGSTMYSFPEEAALAADKKAQAAAAAAAAAEAEAVAEAEAKAEVTEETEEPEEVDEEAADDGSPAQEAAEAVTPEAPVPTELSPQIMVQLADAVSSEEAIQAAKLAAGGAAAVTAVAGMEDILLQIAGGAGA